MAQMFEEECMSGTWETYGDTQRYHAGGHWWTEGVPNDGARCVPERRLSQNGGDCWGLQPRWTFCVSGATWLFGRAWTRKILCAPSHPRGLEQYWEHTERKGWWGDQMYVNQFEQCAHHAQWIGNIWAGRRSCNNANAMVVSRETARKEKIKTILNEGMGLDNMRFLEKQDIDVMRFHELQNQMVFQGVA